MSRYQVKLGSRRERGVVANLFGSLFFLVFGGLGLAFTIFLGTQVYRDAQTYRWPGVPCTVLESGITDKGGNSPYHVQVQYQYQWQGQTYTSQQLATQPRTFSDYSEAQRLADRFRSDTRATCYVNPSKPADAILQHNPLWTALFIVIPLLFVFIGFGGLYVIWRKVPESAPAKTVRPLQGQRFSLFFWSAFFLIGCIVFVFITVIPVIKMVKARDWSAVPCTVVSSRVKSHQSDDGTTYSVDILYRYEIDGREYRANRYAFLGGSSSGRSGKQEIVDRHSPGTKTTCYVNPRDPTDAVLHRGFTPTMLFGLIPLLFVGIGLIGLVATLRKRQKASPTDLPRGPAPMKVGGIQRHTPGMSVELKPKASPLAKVIGGACVSIFWNGIVSVFIVLAVRMWTGREDGPKWFLTIFLIPFVLVGLFLIYYTIHSFFGLFSPRARLRAGHTPVALGESVEITWQFEGRLDKLRDLKLLLEGREERDEGSGKNRRTRRDVFYKADIAHFTNVNDVKTGSVLCTIPADHSPSDADGEHRVVWVIRLKAEVEMGADLDDEYPIEVVSAVSVEEGA